MRDATDPTDLDWMELHLRCLYHHDAKERMLAARQPGGGPAPVFHVGRTRLGNLWRFRDDLDAGRVCDLARLVGREPALSIAEDPPPLERQEAIRRVLATVPGGPASPAGAGLVEWRGPAFRFPATIQIPDGPLPLVEITEDRSDLLARTFADWLPEIAARQPCIAVVDDDHAVALCCPSRPLEVAGSPACAAAEAGVETWPAARGRGHAPRVVAAWAQAVRDRGGEPLYSTRWDNRASRAVARKLGLIQYGEDFHLSIA